MSDKVDGQGSKPPYTNRGVSWGSDGLSAPPASQDSVETEYDKSTRVTTGVDWFTVTTREDRIGMGWLDVFIAQERLSIATGGGKAVGLRNRWYEGNSIDGLSWGYSPKNGYILIASSDMANRLWQSAYVPGRAKCTRVDLAVTVILKKQEEGLALRSYNDRRSLSKSRRYSCVMNSKSGQTLYVGSRTSESYGRLYDKGVETGIVSGGYCWRYEIELKKPLSDAMVLTLLDRVNQTDKPELLLTTIVYNWFAERGIKPIFTPSDRARIIVQTEFSRTTNNKKLLWLRSGVAPSVSKLMEDGLIFEVVDALGLATPGVRQLVLEELLALEGKCLDISI